MNKLIAHWKELNLTQPPYAHPKDIPFFKHRRPVDLEHPILDAETFPKDKLANTEHFFHLSLLPAPFIGDLEKADIFILMLNPGFQRDEYKIEARSEVKTALIATLSQELENVSYPFWYLDPQYQEHPGHKYWHNNLQKVGSYDELSQRVAVLQMMPYHSARFNADVLAKELPSARVAREYVHQVVVPKANQGKALLIVARQVRNWGFSAEDATGNIIIYSGGENRGAKVSSGSRGGKAIINWLSR